MSKLPKFITDKSKRDDLKEKVEVVFAVFTIAAFVSKKMKEKEKKS